MHRSQGPRHRCVTAFLMVELLALPVVGWAPNPLWRTQHTTVRVREQQSEEMFEDLREIDPQLEVFAIKSKLQEAKQATRRFNGPHGARLSFECDDDTSWLSAQVAYETGVTTFSCRHWKTAASLAPDLPDEARWLITGANLGSRGPFFVAKYPVTIFLGTIAEAQALEDAASKLEIQVAKTSSASSAGSKSSSYSKVSKSRARFLEKSRREKLQQDQAVIGAGVGGGEDGSPGSYFDVCLKGDDLSEDDLRTICDTCPRLRIRAVLFGRFKGCLDQWELTRGVLVEKAKTRPAPWQEAQQLGIMLPFSEAEAAASESNPSVLPKLTFIWR